MRVRVVTVCQSGHVEQTAEKNREYVMALLDRALAEDFAVGKPDIVCLPEAFSIVGLSQVPLEEKVEPVPGPTTDACAKRAREHRCYVICPLKMRRDGAIWNSAVILDRQGQVAGVYDKVCPVTSSPDYTVFEGGVTPGAEAPVFDLDFGRIGIQICFDLGFEENWAELAAQGARLVFWPSAYDGGFPLRAFAYLHHYYVVSSVRHGASRIIDPLGAIQAETTPRVPIIARDVNLDFVVAHGDFNFEIPERIGTAYAGRVEVRESAPGSGHFLVEPIDTAITTGQLQKEFGFESTRTYHDRHRAAFREICAGRPPTPQRALHQERAQYPG